MILKRRVGILASQARSLGHSCVYFLGLWDVKGGSLNIQKDQTPDCSSASGMHFTRLPLCSFQKGYQTSFQALNSFGKNEITPESLSDVSDNSAQGLG